MLRVSLILFIVVSVAVLYAETSPALVPTGPASEHCQRVVSAYCSDKNSRQDPGCFVLTAAGQPVSPARPLQFWCSGADCFGHGDNFGSASSKRECGSQSQGLELGSPFQSSADLAQSYRRVPNLLTSRGSRQRQSDVCRRIECAGILTALGSGSGSGSVASTLAPLLWYYAELLIGVGFTAELLLRLWVAASFREHASNALTWVDVLSVVPFFAELAYAGGSAVVDFSVLPSAPLPVFLTLAKSLKVTRLLKAARYTSAAKSVVDSVKRTLPRLGAALGLLAAFTTLFAILFYEIEAGGGARGRNECFVGDVGCRVPPSASARGVRTGDRIVLNSRGDDESRFGSVFSSAWFALVTLTQTGLGDSAPSTYGGQVVNIALMLGSVCFFAFPLTIAATTFHSVLSLEREGAGDQRAAVGEISKRARQRAETARARKNLASAWSSLDALRLQLAWLLETLNRPPADPAVALRIIELPLAARRSWLLSLAAEVAAGAEAQLLGCRRDMYTLCFCVEKDRMDARAALSSHGTIAPRSL